MDALLEKPLLYPFVLCLITLVLTFFFLIKRLFATNSVSHQHLPPSPSQLPIIGHFHKLLGKHPHRLLLKLSQKHGPFMLLRFGSVQTLVVSSAEAAQEVMKTHDIEFADRPRVKIVEKLFYNYKDVSFAPYGEYWRQIKSICVIQLLSNKRVYDTRKVREEETALVVNKIKDLSSYSLPVDLTELFVKITNDISCQSAFGKKYSEGEDGRRTQKILKEFLELLGGFYIGDFVPWLEWVNRISGVDARVERVFKQLDNFLQGVVEDHKNNQKIQLGEKDIHVEQSEDFVDILLRVQKETTHGITIDNESVKAILLDIYAAGTDTTATAMEWAMTELLRHSNCMNIVQKEVREIAGGKPDITDDDLNNMQYLKAVIKETLRLHPPVPLLVPRAARRDVKVNGFDIAAGTIVTTNAWAIGRDPATWSEAEEFQPERFLNSSIDFRGHDFQLIPFGAGRRICPGISFAMATNEYVLANLLRNFDWKLPYGRSGRTLDMSESTGVTVRRKVPLIAVATSC